MKKYHYTKISQTFTAEDVLFTMRLDNGDYQEELAQSCIDLYRKMIKYVTVDDYAMWFNDMVDNYGVEDEEGKRAHFELILEIAPKRLHKQLRERLALEML
jgi:hypothetical protein